MWIVPPSLESHYAPASACSTKESSSPFLEHALRVSLNGRVMLKPASWPGWKRRAWSRRLYGAIRSNPFLPNSLMGELTGLLPDFPANRTALPESAGASQTSDGFGKQSRSSFAGLGLDSFFWKTFADSSLPLEEPPSERFSGTWPSSGSMCAGRCFALPRWVPPISEPGSSCWPTARANDSEKRGTITPNQRAGLPGAVQLWPTAKASDGDKGSPNQAGSRGDPMLAGAAIQWQTPAADSFRGRGADRKDEMGLDRQARTFWASPKASTGGPDATSAAHEGAPNLKAQTASWPTPAARDAKGANSELHVTQTGTGRMHMDQLPNYVAHCFSHPAPTPTSGPASSNAGLTSPRRLNPAFVCFLMNSPWWWTRAEPMPFAAREMASYLCRQRSLLDILLGG